MNKDLGLQCNWRENGKNRSKGSYCLSLFGTFSAHMQHHFITALQTGKCLRYKFFPKCGITWPSSDYCHETVMPSKGVQHKLQAKKKYQGGLVVPLCVGHIWTLLFHSTSLFCSVSLCIRFVRMKSPWSGISLSSFVFFHSWLEDNFLFDSFFHSLIGEGCFCPMAHCVYFQTPIFFFTLIRPSDPYSLFIFTLPKSIKETLVHCSTTQILLDFRDITLSS